MQRTIGSTRITSVVEQPLDGIDALLAASTPEEVAAIDWLQPNFVDDDGAMVGLVQMLVVEHGGRLVVVDTCVGNDRDRPVVEAWNQSQTDFLDRFGAAGFDPESVDVVLCTHLHLDHVGWNTRLDGDRWVPTFPNARYLFDRTEYEHWSAESAVEFEPPAGMPDAVAAALGAFHDTQANVQADAIRPVVDAGLVDLVDAPCEVLTGLRLVPTRGHTLGHVSVAISSDGGEGLITGDCFHHPSQMARPEWAAVVDSDPEASTATRRRLLSELAGSDTLVIGTHFAEPVCGRVVADGESHRLITDDD